MFFGIIFFGAPDPLSAQTSFLCGTASPEGNEPPDSLPENFQPICTDTSLVKYIRVNFHIVLRDDGTGNFTETTDPFGDPSYNGYQRAEDIINKANEELANNAGMWRKAPGVFYPVNPPENKVRYLLTGVYFHRNTQIYESPWYDFAVHDLYGVNTDTEINVYSIPLPEGSDGREPSGVANTVYGTSNLATKIEDALENYLNYPEWSLEHFAANLNHEVGHLLKLLHTWDRDDECEDTPKGDLYDYNGNGILEDPQERINCWDFNSTPPCNDWDNISNNIMDYNQWVPHAYSVCQIARMNDKLTNTLANNYVHSCNGCMPSVAFFALPSEYCSDVINPGTGTIYPLLLNGQASFAENRYLLEICEVSSPDDFDCDGNYYNSGWQVGPLGILDLTQVYDFTTPDRFYKVKIIVDNTDCPLSDEMEVIIRTKECMGTTDPEPVKIRNLVVYTNPTNGITNVGYEILEEGNLNLYLTDFSTGFLFQIIADSQVRSPGTYLETLDLSILQPGPYRLMAFFQGEVLSQTIIKQ